MKIVVTGSSGRLGRATARQLVERGHEVVPVDQKGIEEAGLPATRLVDATDYQAFRAVIEGAEAICHLGNYPTIETKAAACEGFANNVLGTFTVFEAANDAGIRKIVYASSIQAYGICISQYDNPRLHSKPLYLPVDEDHPLLPRDAYPLGKGVAESVAESFARRDERLQAVSLRFTYIVGVNGKGRVQLASARKEALASSLATYIHVEDAARAVRLACEIDRPGHVALNIVSGESMYEWSMEQLRESYGEIPEFREGFGSPRALVSGKRASEVLGFTAELTPMGERIELFQKA